MFTQDSAQLSPIVILCRVLCCSWSRSLWKFQEGKPAKKNCFQFADRVLAMDEVVISLFNIWTIGSNGLMEIIHRAYCEGLACMILNPARPILDRIREALKLRAISVASDEALWLFTNLQLDIGLIARVSPEEIMSILWRTLQHVPAGL